MRRRLAIRISSMHRPKYARQVVLFLVSAVLPAIVLIGLAVYVIRQDSELASRRGAHARVRALAELRSELGARLSEITLRELNRRMQSVNEGATGTSDSAVVFIGSQEDLRAASGS